MAVIHSNLLILKSNRLCGAVMVGDRHIREIQFGKSLSIRKYCWRNPSCVFLIYIPLTDFQIISNKIL